MKYNFDEEIDRHGTVCEKYDATEAIFGTSDIIPMWIADTDFRTPEFITEALSERIKHPIFGYSFRCPQYYDAIRSWLLRRNDWDVKTEWLDFTPGVVCGLSYGINSLSHEGDGVIIQSPVYPPFARTIRANNRVVINNPLLETESGWEIDFEDLEQKLPKAKLFILCNPHNPTGKVYSYDELKRIGDLCVKYGVYIICDEIHSDLIIPGNKHIHIASISDDIAAITLTYVAPSKTFNVAGFSTAVAIIPNANIMSMYRAAADRIHVDQGNIFGAVALRAGYTHGDEWLDELMKYVESNIDYTISYIGQNMPLIRCKKPQSTFLLWLNFEDMGFASHDELCHFLVDKAKIGLNSGIDFGVEGNFYMRMNLGTTRSTITRALEQLKNAYAQQCADKAF